MVHLHNGILLSYEKNAFNAVAMRGMNLEWINRVKVRKRKTHTVY